MLKLGPNYMADLTELEKLFESYLKLQSKVYKIERAKILRNKKAIKNKNEVSHSD